MKKVIALVTVVMALASTAAFAEGVTPVKLSLFPGVAVPSAMTVHGLDLGIIASKPDEVQGVQLAWIYAGASKKMVGLQSGLVASATSMTGLQYGFYNTSEDVHGVQLGFINVAEKMKGLQIGLVNVIKKDGWLPFMVIINGSF